MTKKDNQDTRSPKEKWKDHQSIRAEMRLDDRDERMIQALINSSTVDDPVKQAESIYDEFNC